MASVFYKEILDARRHLEEWILRQSDYHPRILYPAKLSDKCKEEKKDISKMGRTHSKKFLPCTLSQETTGRCASAKPGKKDKKEEEEIRSNAGRGQSNSRMMSQGTAGQQSHKATNLDWRRMMKGVRKVISGKNTRSGGSV